MVIDLSPEQCRTLLDFIYTGKNVWETVDDAIDMLHLSHMYQIRSLREQCLKFLYDNIDKEYSLRLWDVAKLLDLRDLEEKSSTIISKEFALLSTTEEFLQLNRPEVVVELLGKKDLNAEEETIVKAGLSWIESDFVNREIHSDVICKALKTSSDILSDLLSECDFPQLRKSGIFTEAMSKYGQTQKADWASLNLEECLVVLGGNDEGSNRNVICFGFRQKKWFTLPPMQYDPKMYFSVCTDRCKLYVSGGFGKGTGFCVYDAKENTWRNLPVLLSPRQNHCMAFSNEKIIVLGGTDTINNSNFIKEIDVFDARRNCWSEIRTTINQVVKSSAFCVSEGKVFLFGGICPLGKKAEKLQYFDMREGYSAGEKWCFIPEQIRVQARAVVVNNTVLIISKDGEIFRMKKNRGDYSFEKRGCIEKFPRKGFGVCELDGKILIVGGEKDFSKTKDMVQYKPDENFTFTMEETMPLSMSNFCYAHMFVKRENLTNECRNQLLTRQQ